MAPILPSLAVTARNLLSRALSGSVGETNPSAFPQPSPTRNDNLGPLAARTLLLARDASTATKLPNYGSGVVDPHSINNTFVFVLFGLIGLGLVITMIWFFFWAKNGGFYFKQNDWDDYKSTVLRRKGPNGTLLSGATPSTNLGGGSVYKDYDNRSTEYTGAQTHTASHLAPSETATTMTGITAGASDLAAREKRAKKREKREKKEREKEKSRDRKSRKDPGRRGEDGVLVDEQAEAQAQDAVRQYRHERSARVGGINKISEGSEWDGSTNPSNSSASSDLLSNQQPTPTKEDKKSGGIRKVYSTYDRNQAREQQRIRAEARRLQEKGRAASRPRRDFSFQRAESSDKLLTGDAAGSDVTRSELSSKNMPGSWNQSDVSSDLGTKSYVHHIPGLSSSGGEPSGGGTDIVDYAEEKRRKRASGYRRGGRGERGERS